MNKPPVPPPEDNVQVSITTVTNNTTVTLLAKDRARATDVLLQLRYQLSRTVSSIEIK